MQAKTSSNARKHRKRKGKKLDMEEKKEESLDVPPTTRRPPHPSRAIMIPIGDDSSSSREDRGEGSRERPYNRGDETKQEADTLPSQHNCVMIALRASTTRLYDDDLPKITGHKQLDRTRDDQNKDASLRKARKPKNPGPQSSTKKRRELERTDAKGQHKTSQSVERSLVRSEKSQSAKELGHRDRRTMKSQRQVKSSRAVLSEAVALASEKSAESKRMLADVEIGGMSLDKSPSLRTTSTASGSMLMEPSSLSLEREEPYSRPGAFRVGGTRRSMEDSSCSSGESSSDEEDDEEVAMTADVQRYRASLLRNARFSVLGALSPARHSKADKKKQDKSTKQPSPASTKTSFSSRRAVWQCAVIGLIILLLAVVVVVVVVLAGKGKRTTSSEVGTVEALGDNPVLSVMVVQWAAAFDTCGTSIQEPLEIEFECGEDGRHYVEVLGFQHSQNQSSGSLISCESRVPGLAATNRQRCHVQSVQTASALATSEVDFMVGCSVPEDDAGLIPLKTHVKPITGSSCGRTTGSTTSQVVGEVSTGVTVKHVCLAHEWLLNLPHSDCNGGTEVNGSFCSVLGSCTGNDLCAASTMELDTTTYLGFLSACFFTNKDSNSDFEFYTSEQINQVWEKAIDDTATAYAEQNHWSLSTLGPP